MTEMSYSQKKNSVLKQYEEFLPIVNKARGEGPATYDTTLDRLKKDIDNIRKDVFRLMVVGEAKSGKSTFINAYLGTEILPMDIKQCTSAIVEIRYGKRHVLKATFADGTQREICDEDGIKAFLVNNAAVDDEYRDIPTSIIDLQLIIPLEGREPYEREIEELLEIVKNDNIYKLSPEEYSKRIRDYISKKTPCWNEIAEKIEIEYPFKDPDLQGIQIVDSPGVSAEGHMEEITKEYVVKADAVMFLKPIVGSTLETISFKKFLESASADRNPDAMFLVLTRAANDTPDNIAKLREDAYKQFPGINRNQILHLDSKVELFRNRIYEMTEEQLQDYMERKIDEAEQYWNKINSLPEDKKPAFVEEHRNLDILNDFIETQWYRAHANRDKFLSRLADLSNFREMNIALNQFARKSHYIQLSQALARMETILRKIEAELAEDISNYRKKADDPDTLEAELLNTNEQIKDLQRKMHESIDLINSRYKETGGIIKQQADKVFSEYKEEIGSIDPNRFESIDELQKVTFRRIRILTDFEDEIRKKIVAECDEALIRFSDKGALNYTSLKPDLTPETIEAIKSEHHEAAMEIKSGGCFNRKKQSVLNQARWFTLIRDDIQNRLLKIKRDLISSLEEYVTQVTSAYRTELARNASILRARYEKILEDKATAEEMLEKIAEMETLSDEVKSRITQIIKVKGGIDKNVKA